MITNDDIRTSNGTYVPNFAAPAMAVTRVGNGFSTAAIILGILAVFILPIVLGPVGLALAAKANTNGEANADLAKKVAGIGTLLGIALGLAAVGAMSS